MPNGTLCGKAIVDMLLGEEDGVLTTESVAETMIKAGDLPKAYVITKERIEKAMELDEVKVQDEKGAEGRKRWHASRGGARLV